MFPGNCFPVASSHMVLIRISHEYLIHLEVHYGLHCTTHPFWLIAIPRQPWQRHLSGGFLVAEGYRGRTKRGKRTVCQTSGCRLEAGGFRSDIVDICIWCIYGIICRMRYMMLYVMMFVNRYKKWSKKDTIKSTMARIDIWWVFIPGIHQFGRTNVITKSL